MNRPILSVVIPTWNRAKYISKAINSALIQGKRGEIEVIVIDDCSDDNTAKLLADNYGPRIKYQRLNQRSGVGKARNIGIGLATGELLGFLDSDDHYLPNKLTQELTQFEQFPNTDIVLSNSQSFIEHQPQNFTRFELIELTTPSATQASDLNDCHWVWSKSANSMTICSITFRRQLIHDIGLPLFAEDLISCEDWELELKLYPHRNIRVLPQVLSHIHFYPDKTRTKRGISGQQTTLEQQRLLYQDRLTVMARNQLPTDIDETLINEYQRQYQLNQQQLQMLKQQLANQSCEFT